MPPIVNRESLLVLNGAGPFVIFGGADGESLGRYGMAPEMPVYLYYPARGSDHPGMLLGLNVTGGDDLVDVQTPPSALCVLACMTEEGERQLEELRTWWTDCGLGEAPQALRIPGAEGQPGQYAWHVLHEHLLRAVAEERADASRREVQVRAELVDLRYEYEQARAAEAKLQSLMDRLRLSPWQLTVALEPSGDAYRPSSDVQANAPHLTQPFPESSEGLAGFDLHITLDKPSAKRCGVLRVSLRAMDENQMLGRWQIPYEALTPGWFRFAFDRALKEPFHDLLLSLSWQSESGHTPALTLSPTEAWPDVHARTDGTSLGRSLAMRVWRGLPGLRLSSLPPGPREAMLMREDADEIEYELGVRDYDRVCETTVGVSEDHFSRLEGGIGFRLHPAPPFGKPTSTVLLRACGEGVTQVVGTALIAHPECKSEIEFVLCLTDSSAQCPRIPEDLNGDGRVLASSGWIRVPPDGKPHVIVVPLQSPLRSPADLHFATRVPLGGSFEWAWADWLKVGLRLRSPRSGQEAATVETSQPERDHSLPEKERVVSQQAAEASNVFLQELEDAEALRDAREQVVDDRERYIQELERVNARMVEQRTVTQRILDETEARAIRAEQELQLYKTPFLRRTLRRMIAQARRSPRVNKLVRRILTAYRGVGR